MGAYEATSSEPRSLEDLVWKRFSRNEMKRCINWRLLQQVGHSECYASIAEVEISSSAIEFDGNFFFNTCTWPSGTINRSTVINIADSKYKIIFLILYETFDDTSSRCYANLYISEWFRNNELLTLDN